MDSKTLLRIRFKEERKKFNIEIVSNSIVANIRQENFYRTAKNVMLFYPLKYEINLLDLLQDDKNFYFPKVDGENLLVCPYMSNVTFEKSALNIYEPCSAPVRADILDLIFVPALAVDTDNYRLGYGGGFYDKFLKTINAFTVVPVYEDFVVDKLPHDDFDIPVDCIITNGKKARR